MKVLQIFILLFCSTIAICQTSLPATTHAQKPIQSTDSVLSTLQMEQMINSNYARTLDTLYFHVEGCTVMNAYTGNAGFILVLDNKSWAAAYRVDSMVLYDFGNGRIPQAIIKKINSYKLGNTSEPIGNNQISATEKCNIPAELKKTYGRKITGLSIGYNTFNFSFEKNMELEFLLINDKKNKPAIRVFWEQW